MQSERTAVEVRRSRPMHDVRHQPSCYTVATTQAPIHRLFYAMLTTVSRHVDIYSRSLRARLVALLVLIAQVTSLLIVPIHVIAHADTVRVSAVTPGSVSDANDDSLFSPLFGHAQGVGCDEWNAAFALDCQAGNSLPEHAADLPSTTHIFGGLSNAPPATPFRQFLARAPPRL